MRQTGTPNIFAGPAPDSETARRPSYIPLWSRIANKVRRIAHLVSFT
jgi:hypothetical protein